MLQDKNRVKFYYPLIMTLLGGASYDFFSKMAVYREQSGDYASIIYLCFSVAAFAGAVVAALGLIELGRFVTSLLNSVTEHKDS